MENPRSEKVAVVDEVKQRLSSANAAILTEYRGLKVGDLSALRRSLTESGGDYKIYKNTLVRFAVRDMGIEGLEELLTGPTAIAFVDGDAVGVAKALRDFARTNPLLVVKGGVLGDSVLSAADATALADIPPREVLLGRFAGLLAAPMQQFAGLLQAIPRNFAYGLKALIELGGAPGAPASAPAADDSPTGADTPSAETSSEEQPMASDTEGDVPAEGFAAPATPEEAAETEVVDTLDHLAAAADVDADVPTETVTTDTATTEE